MLCREEIVEFRALMAQERANGSEFHNAYRMSREAFDELKCILLSELSNFDPGIVRQINILPLMKYDLCTSFHIITKVKKNKISHIKLNGTAMSMGTKAARLHRRFNANFPIKYMTFHAIIK